ncbi:hypothetical protein EC968_005990 [Mortierella alpina]|nr:hypothetical protein EC968_005990 [Mortierella alpina]
MIPYYPAVYIGPNGEQFPVGYHPPPMALPFEQHPHPHPHPLPHQHQHQNQPQHQQPPQHHPNPHQQHTLLQHQQQQQQQHQHQHPQHPQLQQRGPFPIHGPTSAPLPFVGTTTKPSATSSIETISTPDMHQLETSASLESIDSGATASPSGARGGSERRGAKPQEEKQEPEAEGELPLPLPLSDIPRENQVLDPSTAKASTAVSVSRDRKTAAGTGFRPTSHRPNQPAPQDKLPSDIPALATTAGSNGSRRSRDRSVVPTPAAAAAEAVGAETGAGAIAPTPAALALSQGTPNSAAITPAASSPTSPTSMTPGATAQSKTGSPPAHAATSPSGIAHGRALEAYACESINDIPGQKGHRQVQEEHRALHQDDPTSSSPPQPKQQPQKSPSSSHHPQHHQPPSPHASSRQSGSPTGAYPTQTFQQQYPQPPHRSTPPSPYYPSRQSLGQTKAFTGQQGQGPGLHGPLPLPPGPAPNQQGFGMPPPFFNPNVPPSPGSRRPIVYAGQGPNPSGSHPMPLPGVRPVQQYMGFKQPYPGQGFHHDYPQPGYFQTPEGWRPGPPPTLQKKPKELDKAMWVGNVLNDTTVAELQAIFEAEPTEAEGDVEHDIPESIFILSKSNCAFVNYSSHEAVDRAVRRFHDREFKNTRLVCRPRKDPASEYVNKVPSSNRFQHQVMHYGQAPYISEPMGYYNHDHPLLAQRMDPRYELSDAQTRMERMRLEASPAPGSSSSGGDGSTSLDPFKHKDKGGSKKSRSTSSLGYAESRYFIMKGLNDEDLKLSVQYGLWATQDHLVPLLNEAFSNSKNVFLIFSANKSGEFFGCARMLDLISVENEIAITTGKEEEIWQPAGEIQLSPEMKAAMLEEIEQAAKEGRKITNEEAEVIARASTTTKTWGIRFPIQWLHVVPFTRTSHLLNPLYENREVKVSKDGTEVDPAVGEQLIKLFIKSSRDHRDRGSMDDTGSRSTSEAGGSRRSSVTGDSSVPASQQTQQRSTSTRRSSIISTRSTESGSGERRPSIDPSRAHGPGYKQAQSPHPPSYRSQFSGDGGHASPLPGASNYRSSTRHHYNGPRGNHAPIIPQGVYPPDHQQALSDPQRHGWNSKTGYRGGGGYGSGSHGGPSIQGGYYPSDHRKGGGKFGSNYYSGQSSAGVGGNGQGYDQSAFHSNNASRRQPGASPPQQYPGNYRPHAALPHTDVSYKHGGSATAPAAVHMGPHDHGYTQGLRGGPPSRHGVSNPTGGQTLPPHPGYAGQGPPAGYHTPYPPPGYPVMQPYMGYPYMPGPTPYMPGAMPWHPGQGPPIAANMMPGPGMVPGHATSLPPMLGTNADGAGMNGMVPLIGYDGVAYGYIPAEEAYSQQMYGYSFMPHDHDPQTSEQTDPAVSSNESDEAAQGHGDRDLESSGRQSGDASSPSVRDAAEGDPASAEGLSSTSESLSTPTATVNQQPSPVKDREC